MARALFRPRHPHHAGALLRALLPPGAAAPGRRPHRDRRRHAVAPRDRQDGRVPQPGRDRLRLPLLPRGPVRQPPPPRPGAERGHGLRDRLGQWRHRAQLRRHRRHPGTQGARRGLRSPHRPLELDLLPPRARLRLDPGLRGLPRRARGRSGRGPRQPRRHDARRPGRRGRRGPRPPHPALPGAEGNPVGRGGTGLRPAGGRDPPAVELRARPSQRPGGQHRRLRPRRRGAPPGRLRRAGPRAGQPPRPARADRRLREIDRVPVEHQCRDHGLRLAALPERRARRPDARLHAARGRRAHDREALRPRPRRRAGDRLVLLGQPAAALRLRQVPPGPAGRLAAPEAPRPGRQRHPGAGLRLLPADGPAQPARPRPGSRAPRLGRRRELLRLPAPPLQHQLRAGRRPGAARHPGASTSTST